MTETQTTDQLLTMIDDIAAELSKDLTDHYLRAVDFVCMKIIKDALIKATGTEVKMTWPPIDGNDKIITVNSYKPLKEDVERNERTTL